MALLHFAVAAGMVPLPVGRVADRADRIGYMAPTEQAKAAPLPVSHLGAIGRKSFAAVGLEFVATVVFHSLAEAVVFHNLAGVPCHTLAAAVGFQYLARVGF